MTSRYVQVSINVTPPTRYKKQLQREINKTPFGQRKLQNGGNCEILEMAIAIYFH